MSRMLGAVGLGTGAGFGMAGGFLPPGQAQDAAWFVSSVGLIVGCLVLSARLLGEGRDLAAAGFLLLAFGEVIMQGGQGSSEAARLAAFARGVGLYVPGLVLLAWSDRYPVWVRSLSGATAAPFCVHVVLYFVGQEPAEQGPAASVAYALLTATIAGWIWSVYRSQPVGEPSSSVPTARTETAKKAA